VLQALTPKWGLFKEIFMAEVKPEMESFARIKVVGIGGSGNSTINRMIDAGVRGVEFIAVNTDAQALHHTKATKKVHIGKNITRGLGAGADPEVGLRAAEEDTEMLKDVLKGADMVFVTCGMGGGTGTKASSVIASISKEIGALTVGVITRPFSFEGERRKRIAEEGIDLLHDKVDTLITIPNDRLLQIIDRKTSLLEAFGIVDDVMRQGIQSVSDLITVHGLINVDFADVKTIMANAGSALMGIGRGSGENRAVDAAKQAINSPLLELSINGAKGVLFNVTGGPDLGMFEIDEAAKVITQAADPQANIIFGSVIDPNISGEVRITVIATGFAGVDKSPMEAHSIGSTLESDEDEDGKNIFGGFGRGSKTDDKKDESFDDLEIPAFIRKRME
jgi:cell division protein FtsZ